MKTILASLVIVIMSIFSADCASAATASNDTVYVVTVSPAMHCVNCENKIKQNIRFEKGVKSITVDRAAQRVSIKADRRKTTMESLAEAFKKIGYQISPVATTK